MRSRALRMVWPKRSSTIGTPKLKHAFPRSALHGMAKGSRSHIGKHTLWLVTGTGGTWDSVKKIPVGLPLQATIGNPMGYTRITTVIGGRCLPLRRSERTYDSQGARRSP